jgi:hypothetical protein
MADTARAIKAGYWLISDGDWSAEEAAMVEGLKLAAERTVEACRVAAEFRPGVVIRRMNAGQCGLPGGPGR